jgi:hypothetical protein
VRNIESLEGAIECNISFFENKIQFDEAFLHSNL